MKIGIVISTQPTSFSALLYEEALEENIVKIKKLGYDGIELAVRDPKLLDIDSLISVLKKNRLTVPAIGTGQLFGEEGLSFTNPDPAIRKETIMRIKSHICLADKLNAIVIVGLVRGKKDIGISNEQLDQWLIEAFRECASENRSVKLAIEPINRYETDIINTVESGLNFIEKVDMENVGLLLDTFHMNIEEPSMAQSIVLAKDHLFHFHIADSNRWYPGAGHINFAKLFYTLKKIDYRGFVSAEILPLPDPDTATLKTIEYWQKLKF